MHDHGHAAGDKFLKNETVSFVGSLRAARNGPMPWVGTTGRLCKRSDDTKCQFSRFTRSDDNPNNPNNPAPGTLRYAVSLYSASPRGVSITFSHDMKIQLKEMLHVYNHTTIDGRGVRVIITGYSIELNKVQDVILHNFQVSDINSDTVHIFESKMVWVDHLTSFNGQRVLVSAVQGSTDITIPNCRLSNDPTICYWVKMIQTQLTSKCKSLCIETRSKIQTSAILTARATFHQFLSNGPVVAPPYKTHRQYPPVISTGKLPRLLGYCSGVLLKESVRSCRLRGKRQ
ncbi:hypothetical protein SUGI_1012390 [Cryptomeria japonica]|nr:hypothetical protein SUGI_1012390 [Cryptomeria japonica]